ncbi:metallopeptidase TldD-related protein [Brenneria sp. L4-2C]|uniref:metallopeptidase TldD-related protein n=1 Tax=Brenneria sp. L4-2C TaxID=3094863 RepID=UPI0029C2C037|nr:metallopeptidase TldD-related protein [Brenneria sp. L4-2C]MDX5693515.1 metallopeptidase TldD-related protein [Brenneria sp. L4-2C]
MGKLAANRALSRLNPRQVKTKKSPVLFDALLAKDIVGIVSTALNGISLFSQTSFLIDSLGREIFAGDISVIENPHVRASFGSAPFDGEGVKTRRRHIIRSGVVEEYFLSSYSAKKLGMKTTGNASGSHGLFVYSTLTKPEDDLASMLRKLGTGLYVTRLFGQGVNLVTGGFSRAAAGFWVENGEIQYPVEGVTVAGNLQDIYSGIAGVGADRFNTGSFECGSLLVEQMSIGGI